MQNHALVIAALVLGSTAAACVPDVPMSWEDDVCRAPARRAAAILTNGDVSDALSRFDDVDRRAVLEVRSGGEPLKRLVWKIWVSCDSQFSHETIACIARATSPADLVACQGFRITPPPPRTQARTDLWDRVMTGG